jgi:16S rRNA (cytidine1402-2'-O)-methyltransferase
MNITKIIYIIGVPIGNIFDFTQRAIFILKKSDIIATEDSRKIGLILNFLKIKNKILSINKYNELSMSNIIINYAKNGKNIALISDSGTPLINDPGFFLINHANKNNIKIVPIPGISALTTALSISSIKIQNFNFQGFMPKDVKNKKKILK